MVAHEAFLPEFGRERVRSVWELTTEIKELLEGNFPGVQVAGEISNLSRPQSGHCYLTLKDDRAQMRAVLWRGTAGKLRFEIEDGMQVVCQGDLDVYAPRGTYQLVIQKIEPQGVGALELALRKLRQRLAAEGLFDRERKRPLPRFPRRVAFVTSPTGAAIHDFLQVLARRWQGVDVLIVPVRVQGEGAAAEIAAAIAQVNRLSESIDCLIVGRGGGSLEDLWAFNEETLVRAVFHSRIPVVSAVGHEIDVTLCDLVADVRALTPSEAAELVAPSSEEMAALLRSQQERMAAVFRSRTAAARARLSLLESHRVLRQPLTLMHDLTQRVDELADRAARAARRCLAAAGQRQEALAARLEALSPLAVLGRGYSLSRTWPEGRLVREAGALVVGQQIATRFAVGQAISRVEEIEPRLP